MKNPIPTNAQIPTLVLMSAGRPTRRQQEDWRVANRLSLELYGCTSLFSTNPQLPKLPEKSCTPRLFEGLTLHKNNDKRREVVIRIKATMERRAQRQRRSVEKYPQIEQADRNSSQDYQDDECWLPNNLPFHSAHEVPLILHEIEMVSAEAFNDHCTVKFYPDHGNKLRKYGFCQLCAATSTLLPWSILQSTQSVRFENTEHKLRAGSVLTHQCHADQPVISASLAHDLGSDMKSEADQSNRDTNYNELGRDCIDTSMVITICWRC